jgi:putative Mn2+ efflux pump MntP
MHLIYEIIFVGLVLSADSFSAALAMGHRPFNEKDAFGFAMASGSAEALMALLGALFGSLIISRFSAIDHWVATILLGGVALHMAYEGIQHLLNPEETDEKLEFHSFKKVIIVSFATSIDSLGVGIGLGAANKPIAPFIASIGLWAFVTTLIGLHIAKKLSSKFGPAMSLFGSIVLGYLAVQAFKI